MHRRFSRCTYSESIDFVELSLQCRTELGFDRSNIHELYAFIAYAMAFPDGFLALVDTYDTLESGVPNFLAVALALHCCGRRAVGIRLDSGDLAYLSREARRLFVQAAKRDSALFGYFERFTIVASNNINEPTLRSLAEQVCIFLFVSSLQYLLKNIISKILNIWLFVCNLI